MSRYKFKTINQRVTQFLKRQGISLINMPQEMHISIVSDGKQFKRRIYEDELKRLEKKVKDSKQADLTLVYGK